MYEKALAALISAALKHLLDLHWDGCFLFYSKVQHCILCISTSRAMKVENTP